MIHLVPRLHSAAFFLHKSPFLSSDKMLGWRLENEVKEQLLNKTNEVYI
jgi:hypothetical protein